ncbi:hypothetical protein HNE_1662 [Hyphomonas neptunium ATCC 15444]|uniref:ATP-grasp domain-containing protein n=2 Tax=Hyphomonas TaxID=85 RepID=Q0C1M3_HYPNA|nr:hypothetical protein HNE_1662 [Hyphomonas neptunium ATCC 15444]
MRKLTVPHLNAAPIRPPIPPMGPRSQRHTLDRIAILNNSGHSPGDRTHLTALLADQWRAAGIEVMELSGAGTFVEADLLFLNLSRPVLPEEYRRFAAQYPVSFNAGAGDLRKHLYADGLLRAGSPYKGAVIVKADHDFITPITPPAPRAGFFSLLSGSRRPRASALQTLSANDNYRIYPSLNDVPPEKFGPGHIVQKFLPEADAGRYVLRQYYFLGNAHFLSLLTSGASIIRTSTPQSLEEWSPPEELLDLRAHLSLDYGRIDFVEVDGKPFVISVSRAPALPASAEPGYVPPAYNRLAEALAEALVDSYTTTEKGVF